MSEAAMHWVSPWWEAVWRYEGPNNPVERLGAPLIHAFNPGLVSAQVTVHFNSPTGKLVEQFIENVAPFALRPLSLGAQIKPPPGAGWLYVQSDKPVLLWGATPVTYGDSDEIDAWVQMAFYRYELPVLDVDFPPGGLGRIT